MDCCCHCTVELMAKVGTYSSIGKKRHGLCWWRCGSHLLKMRFLFYLWNSGIVLDVLNAILTLSLFETRLLWNAGVALGASGCELCLLQGWRSCWIILDANIIGNVGLRSATCQLDLSSRYASHISAIRRSIKDQGLSIVNSLDYSYLLIRPASKDQKLLSFLKNP